MGIEGSQNISSAYKESAYHDGYYQGFVLTAKHNREHSNYDDLVLNTFVFGLGAVRMLPFAPLPVITMHRTQVPERAWWGLAFLVICGSVIAYAIYAFALNELAASKVAAFSYLQPIIVAFPWV